MDFADYKRFSLDLRKILLAKSKFLIQREKDSLYLLSRDSCELTEEVYSLHVMLSFFLEKLKIIDLYSLSLEEKETLQRLQKLSFLLWDRLQKKGVQEAKLLHKILSFGLGGKIPEYFWKDCDPDFQEFIQKNRFLDLCAHGSIYLDWLHNDIRMPVYTQMHVLQKVSWQDLQQECFTQDKIRKRAFFWQNDVLFTLNPDMCVEQKILFYQRGMQFLPKEQKAPVVAFDITSEGTNSISVHILTKPKENYWIVLQHQNGKRYSFCMEKEKVFSPREPAFYSPLETDERVFTLQVTQKDIEYFLDRVEKSPPSTTLLIDILEDILQTPLYASEPYWGKSTMEKAWNIALDSYGSLKEGSFWEAFSAKKEAKTQKVSVSLLQKALQNFVPFARRGENTFVCEERKVV